MNRTISAIAIFALILAFHTSSGGFAQANWVVLPTSPNTDLPQLNVHSPTENGVYTDQALLNLTVVKPTSWNQTRYDPPVIAGIAYIRYELDGKTESLFETEFFNPIPNDNLQVTANFSRSLRGLSAGRHTLRVFIFSETQYSPTKGPFGDAMPPFYDYNGTVSSETIHFSVQSERSNIRAVPAEYPTIQAAIDASAEGDTIFLKAGIYQEQFLEINKSLSIVGETLSNAKIKLHPPMEEAYLLGGYKTMVYTSPIRITADNVTLINLTITSDGGEIKANGNQIQILNSTIGNQTARTHLDLTGNGSRILGNTIAGVSVHGNNYTVADNNAANIAISGSFNLIIGNSGAGMSIVGSRNVVVSNTIISGDSGVGIYLINADYNIICNNTEYGSGVGVAFGYAEPVGGSYNILAGNRIEGAGLWGILLGLGSHNVFYGNLIANNRGLGHDGYGLAIGGNHREAPNNLFFGNIFENNNRNFGTNWNVTSPNYFDNGTEGNYWDDYSGTGDAPYIVYGNCSDNHPLLKRPEVTGVVPPLPEPWASLLPIDLLKNPTITYTFTPSQTSTLSLSPKPTSSQSLSPSPSQPESPSPAPSPSVPEMPAIASIIVIGLVTSVAAVVMRKRIGKID